MNSCRDDAAALVERELVDPLAEREIRFLHSLASVRGHEADPLERLELAHVIGEFDELRELVRAREHPIVHEKLDVGEAAGSCFRSKPRLFASESSLRMRLRIATTSVF